jgi:hypothetical protein
MKESNRINNIKLLQTLKIIDTKLSDYVYEKSIFSVHRLPILEDISEIEKSLKIIRENLYPLLNLSLEEIFNVPYPKESDEYKKIGNITEALKDSLKNNEG